MAVDLFTPMVPTENLHPSFQALASNPGFFSARQMMADISLSFEDKDGNFVEQFQTTAFDARLWELYLHVYLQDGGFRLDHSHYAPDYVAAKIDATICVEAVTVNPTQGSASPLPEPDTTRSPAEQFLHEMEHVFPIKFGSPLFSKLKKRYWELPHVGGKPFILAIEDFHQTGSMVRTGHSLLLYLYGLRYGWAWDAGGNLVVKPEEIGKHQVGKKEIPSGFFEQPDVENVSAVLFSNSGTISKFNRMGYMRGYRQKDIVMARVGACYNHDRNSATPFLFKYQVGDPAFPESWGQGLSMFHNPRAIVPVPRELFPGIAHHAVLPNGRMVSEMPRFHPYGSQTMIMRMVQ